MLHRFEKYIFVEVSHIFGEVRKHLLLLILLGHSQRKPKTLPEMTNKNDSCVENVCQ